MVFETDIDSYLSQFNLKSKSGVGMHMFKFTKEGEETVYIASEVTDENNVLDVSYSQWSKNYTLNDKEPTKTSLFSKNSHLKTVWSPIYKFSNGRIAMIAVNHLLQNGYRMAVVDAEKDE